MLIAAPKVEVDTGRSQLIVPIDLLGAKRSCSAEPVSFGVPLPKGKAVHAASVGRLVAPNGEEFAAQLKPLSRWFDGSVHWLLVDAVVLGEYTECHPWHLQIPMHEEPDASACVTGIRASEGTPLFRNFGAFRDFLLERSEWQFIDKTQRLTTIRLGEARTIGEGPVRTSAVQAGEVAGSRGIRIDVQWDLYPTASLARCQVRLRNSRRARHRGGLWDLGDPGSLLFKEFAFRLLLPESPTVLELSPTVSAERSCASQAIKLYQDSSGGGNWHSRNHVNRFGQVPCQFRGYKAWADGLEISGHRASPTLFAEMADMRVGVAVPDFWQQFPKSIGATQREISIGLFPKEWADFHELQGGEQKTHTFWLSLQSIHEPPVKLDWVFAPSGFLPSSHTCSHEVELQGLAEGEGFAAEGFQVVTSEALVGPHSVFAQRERTDEYGWRNYGDFFADHEQLHYHGKNPLISHYNNQFDVLRGLLRQSLRSRDVRWFELAMALARHVIDIDIYHTTADRAAYSGGMFWFTDHYLHARTSTHRTYSRFNAPSNGQSYGGGPGAEHNYTSGLKLYYCLSGDDAARLAVIGLADWVLRMEDGRQTVLGLVDDGPTGLATVSYAKPSRGGANSINALLDAWELTHRAEYCEFAEQLIRRCVHPDVEVADLDLLNLEVSWSYTMFYSSLAKYLALKEEAGQVDAMYVYARCCLLRLGEWMLVHERPYFDQREKLEYPTEAWPAQEFRKANVLRYAARYADELAAAAMRRRANELGDRAWSDLMSFETRTAARALVLVMNEGLLDCASRSLGALPPPVVAEQFAMPPREVFATQRQRVVNRLKSPLGAVHVASQLLKPHSWSRAYKLLKRASRT